MLKLRPRQLLLLSLVGAFATMALKSLAWQLTGSVGFLSDAVESLVNVAGAGFALAMVSIARRPADNSHPYGHSKAEYLSAAFEGGMIFLAALVILATAIERLLNPQPISTLGIGTLLTVLASLINLAIAMLLLKGGKQYNSPALEGDGKHLMTDVWTTAGVVIGVGLAVLASRSKSWGRVASIKKEYGEKFAALDDIKVYRPKVIVKKTKETPKKKQDLLTWLLQKKKDKDEKKGRVEIE